MRRNSFVQAALTGRIGVRLTGGGGYTYYVDSVNGNDANDGRTAASAFATIAAVESAGISAGNTIGLARGSHWREQLTIAVNNVSVVAYGTGDRPILDCSTAYANASFTKTGGRANVYQVAITTNYVASEPGWVSVWEDDVRLVSVASLDLCDSTAGSYYVANHFATSITVYVHATTSGDISASGAVYEIANRLAGLYAYATTGTVVRGVETRRNYGEGGSLKVGLSAVLTDCLAREGNKHNIFVRRGSVLTDCVAEECYYTGSLTMYVYNDNDGNGENVTFIRCTATNTALVAQSQGFYGHYNVSGNFGTVRFEDCASENCATGFSAVHADTIEFIGCDGSTCATVYQLADQNADYRITDGAHVSTTGTTRFVNIVTNGVSATLTNCSVQYAKMGNEGAIFGTSNSLELVLQGCVFNCIDTSGAGRSVVYITGSVAIDADGNTYTQAGDFAFAYYAPNAGSTIVSNNNVFSRSGIGVNLGDTAYYPIANWIATGQDANSTVSA